jgi:hypothetical protein
MIVVSNTSPLTNLAAIGHFELLRELFGQIHIAEGVWRELNHGGQRHPGSHEVENASWIDRHEVENRMLVTILRRDLDCGEAETLVLAIEMKAVSCCSMNRKAGMLRVASACIPWVFWAFFSRPSGFEKSMRSAHGSMLFASKPASFWERTFTGTF